MRRCGRGAKDACCRSSGLAAVSGSWAEGEKYFLRVFPTLTHYWDIVPDTPSGLYIGYIYIYTYSHSIWHSFWQMLSHSFWHSIWHTFRHLCWRSLWHLFWHSFCHLFWHSLAWALPDHAHWDLARAVEVRQCPQIRRSRLRSGSAHWDLVLAVEVGSAHWDLELAVEARQCTLRSGARGWGPAVHTEIWSSRLRSGSAHWHLEFAVEQGGRRKEKVTLIKSRDPHLAGGEQPMGGCNPSQKFQIWPKDSANWEWGMKSISPSFSHIFRVRKKIGICNRWHSKHPRVESHAEPTQRLEACALWTPKSIMNFWQLQTQT